MVVLGILTMAALLVSCADVPSTGPDIKDQRALYRFINGAVDLANVTVTVDGSSVGALAYQANTSYLDLPAGSRKVALSSSAADTARIAMDSDRKGTVVILPKIGTAERGFINIRERRVFDPVGSATAAQVQFLNASTDVTADVTILGPDTVTVTDLGFRSNTGYRNLKPGNYTVSVTEHGSTTVLGSTTFSVAVSKRFTTVIMGSKAALAVKQFVDD
jgi:hypothetical protein